MCVPAHELTRKPSEPALKRGVPAEADIEESPGRDQLPGLAERAGFGRVVHRFVDRSVIAMPGVSPAVKRCGDPWLTMLELDPEQASEEMMEAVPPTPVIERNEEEVRPRECAEQICAALLLEHRIA